MLSLHCHGGYFATARAIQAIRILTSKALQIFSMLRSVLGVEDALRNDVESVVEFETCPNIAYQCGNDEHVPKPDGSERQFVQLVPRKSING